MPPDLHYLSLGDVAQRIRSRELSSVEVTRAILDRIDKLEGKLKSYAIVTSESALKQAAQLDGETASGRSLGPLHGVPIAVKDLCNTAGVPTAAGFCKRRTREVPRRSSWGRPTSRFSLGISGGPGGPSK